MNILHAVILGIVQGLTEFLPVSSSGHLFLLREIFGIEEPSLFFDVMLHVGTLSAVLAVLWREVWAILKRIIQPLTGFLILATLPIIVAAIAFRKPIEEAFATGHFLGISFLITAFLLTIAELISRRVSVTNTDGAKKAGNMNWRDALVIGLFQVVAVLPGVSRSGATITGALSRGLDRDLAARFSFLLSIPAILGALILQLKETAAVGAWDKISGSAGWTAIVAGTIAAAIVGFFAVRFMLKIIREKSLFGFAIYTSALGIFILADQYITGFIF